MPCFHPLQATFSVRDDGKKSIMFSNANAKAFRRGFSQIGQEGLSLPCGRCIGCRLEKSRQWATRCVHEAKMHEFNCFLTLTYSDDKVPADMSLNKKHVQDFVKRLRKKFSDRIIKVFYCGEYGDRTNRPHYHMCLFGVDFSDKKRKFKSGDNWVYTSDILSDLWGFGIASIGELTFESAAYVARYCMKKVVGEKAAEHYGNRIPEFACMSLRPAIGKSWLDKFGKTDCFDFDRVIVRGGKCKPPRYYDKVLEKSDPVRFSKIKEARKERAEEKFEDNTFDRLTTKEFCQEQALKKLVRKLE